VNDEKSIRWERVRNAARDALAAEASWDSRVAAIVEAVWAEFGNHRPVSWVGYYHLHESEMTLGPRRDKPACSPIGLHGACGQAALSGRSLLVRNVRDLGASYIACDPRDLSELVVPVTDHAGTVLGVLDLDSYAEAAFDESDQVELEKIAQSLLGGSTVAPGPR
jgi:putative methionine-R-sulfoxide reductase with GAF domain